MSCHVGIDVGGTHTDAVVMGLSTDTGRDEVISSAKRTTTADVTSGVCRALVTALDRAADTLQPGNDLRVTRVHIGTTQFINAVVQRRDLCKVVALRLCGPATVPLPPFVDFPSDLKDEICGEVELLGGGYEYDGVAEISAVQTQQILDVIGRLKEKKLFNVIVTGVFSPVNANQEKEVEDIFTEHYPEASLTLSHTVGQIGLLERENAAILNESLKPLCKRTVEAFSSAMEQLGLKCPIFLTQNDGTLTSTAQALAMPILTFASGPTNSMRGAAFLAEMEATETLLVVDIGGTTTDVGVLVNRFPRETQMKVKVGGVRTNFRMPDVLSLGLGGGSLVVPRDIGDRVHVTVGPRSTGHRLISDGLVFGGSTLTASDIAVAAGVADMGSPKKVAHLSKDLVTTAMDVMRCKIEEGIDQIKTVGHNLPVVLVGGGSDLIKSDELLRGTSRVCKPKHYDVANAVGAALSTISGTGEALRKGKVTREEAIDLATSIAKEKAILAGADPDAVEITEKSAIDLAYIYDVTHIKVKVVGELLWTDDGTAALWQRGVHHLESGREEDFPTQLLEEDVDEIRIQETAPTIDPSGEWVLSEWDVMCLSVGCTILGCGGGGNPYGATLRALREVRQGKRICIVKPDEIFARMEEGDRAIGVAYMGAPAVANEKLANGIEQLHVLESMQDLYTIGMYADGNLKNTDGVTVKQKDGVKYIDDYKPQSRNAEEQQPDMRPVAIVCLEIGGKNGIELLCTAAQRGLPVVDCDTMGRAFPELQHGSFFIYGGAPYPSVLADVHDTRSVALYAETPKHLEVHFREVCTKLGCTVAFSVHPFNREDVDSKTVHNSYSRAWYIGRAVLRARLNKTSPVNAIVEHAGGKVLGSGKICDVIRHTAAGFTRGELTIERFEQPDCCFNIKFQNEFLICRRQRCDGSDCQMLACTPDLISLVEVESGEPVTVDELRYGLRVAILALPVPSRMSTPRALAVVGPQAFGYSKEEATYTAVDEYTVDTYPWLAAMLSKTFQR